jgi:hypothetical protein
VLGVSLVWLVAAWVGISMVPLFGVSGAVVANAAAQVPSLLWMTLLVTHKLDLTVSQVAGQLRLFGARVLGGLEAGCGFNCVALPSWPCLRWS